MAGEPGGAALDGIMSRMSRTWLRASSGPGAVDSLPGAIESALEELDELGLVARRSGKGGHHSHAYVLTKLGGRFCRSPLPALPAACAVQDLRRSRKMAGEYAAQFYHDAMRAALSVVEYGMSEPPRDAPGDAADSRLLAGYGWRGQAGAGSAWESGAGGQHFALEYYAFANARARRGMSASRLTAAGGMAVDMARALLELADLAHAQDDQEDISEDLACIATRCMLNFLEGGAGLLGLCAAETERGRAAFLLDSLADRPAGPRWLGRRRDSGPPAQPPPAPPRQRPARATAASGSSAEYGWIPCEMTHFFFAGNAVQRDGELALRGGTAGAQERAVLHIPVLDPPGSARRRIVVVHARAAGLSGSIAMEANAGWRGPVVGM